MQQDLPQSCLLLALLLVLPIFQGIKNWRENRLRQRTADAYGWRYWNRGWNRVLLRPSYEIAGTTPEGVVWELRRVQRKRQLYFVWSSLQRLLPYGALIIRPRQAGARASNRMKEGAHQVEVGSERWQSEYVMWTTHTMLAQKYFNQEVELAMTDWPQWPAPGSLEEIIWDRERLVIRVRQHNDWFALNQIVVLGTALVDNAVQRR